MIDQRPTTAEEYVHLVEQAIIEVEEFMACLEFDMEDPGQQLQVLEPILAQVKVLRAGMADGSYRFVNEDLPFMNVANRLSSQLPFTNLLAVINRTHRYGLNIEQEQQ
ncbi:MAG: general secretion pathway protein GspF [Gammaproteobacteria bacterium]|nr:general secretion pathway protein GspF [Gammaproteobacteria bacterium]